MMSDKVLVTGGAGFIGHALIEYLLANTDFEVVSMDRLDVSGNLNRLGDITTRHPEWKARLSVVWHDLKSPVNNYTINKLGKIDYILHLAAGSHVDRSVLYPMEFVMDNVVGTCNILDYARLHCEDLKLFLYFSTDEVFGAAPDGVVFDEDSRYRAGNPYSATKAGGEELCVAYENTYLMPIIITHTMNVYGPRQHPEKFIPIIVNKVLQEEIVEIHSNPELTEASKRCYLHSEDVSSAILFLMNNHMVGEKYNIVYDQESDNLDLAKCIADIIGKPLNYKLVDPKKTRPRHDFRYSLSGEKMKNMGWSPKISLKEGLKQTIEWFLANPEWR
jgi:dTDP-glucose 4,6-dehydratase